MTITLLQIFQTKYIIQPKQAQSNIRVPANELTTRLYYIYMYVGVCLFIKSIIEYLLFQAVGEHPLKSNDAVEFVCDL